MDSELAVPLIQHENGRFPRLSFLREGTSGQRESAVPENEWLPAGKRLEEKAFGGLKPFNPRLVAAGGRGRCRASARARRAQALDSFVICSGTCARLR